MTDERINKILASCWQCLTLDHKHVYENLVKDKKYIEDIRGVREHYRHGSNKGGKANIDIASLPDMDAFGANLKPAAKKKYRTANNMNPFDNQYTA